MDKVQKIHEKIEMVVNRRLNLLNGDYFDLNKEANGFTNEIMDIIDFLQEEPVSESLEEAAKNHAVERYRATRDMVLAEKCKWSFKAGAEWQKEQDKETIELAEDHAMFAGMEKMKEQMMKDAIDGQLEDSDDYLRIKCLSTSCKPEDNGKLVKVIIIKED